MWFLAPLLAGAVGAGAAGAGAAGAGALGAGALGAGAAGLGAAAGSGGLAGLGSLMGLGGLDSAAGGLAGMMQGGAASNLATQAGMPGIGQLLQHMRIGYSKPGKFGISAGDPQGWMKQQMLQTLQGPRQNANTVTEAPRMAIPSGQSNALLDLLMSEQNPFSLGMGQGLGRSNPMGRGY